MSAGFGERLQDIGQRAEGLSVCQHAGGGVSSGFAPCFTARAEAQPSEGALFRRMLLSPWAFVSGGPEDITRGVSVMSRVPEELLTALCWCLFSQTPVVSPGTSLDRAGGCVL